MNLRRLGVGMATALALAGAGVAAAAGGGESPEPSRSQGPPPTVCTEIGRYDRTLNTVVPSGQMACGPVDTGPSVEVPRELFHQIVRAGHSCVNKLPRDCY